MNPVPSSLLQSLVDLSIRAGTEIMAIYATDFSAKEKGDLTPVTEADEAAERIILTGLSKIDGSVPVISEEAASAGRIPDVSTKFFLVDPLDGTKEFISKNGEFTVNIALVEHGVPVAGVVYAPALKRIFWGEKGMGAAHGKVDGDTVSAWHRLAVRPLPADGATVVASRSHRDQATEDTAAGHAVLLAAGGKVVTVEGPVLSYGKRARGYDNPGFIASA